MPRQLMDNTAPAPERAAQKAPSAEVPASWGDVQKGLACFDLLLPVMSCASTPPYGVVVLNSSSVEVNDGRVSYPHFYFHAGVLPPRAQSGHGLVAEPIPVG